ncbi:MAG: PTS sugar transporter subunit IIB [Gemmatimonadales bacterium]
MTLTVCRIDDRLIHGQVVVGWGRPFEIERIVLVDDEVAASEFERELYRMAVPEQMALEFLTVAEATARLPALAEARDRVLVLTGSIPVMAALARSHPELVRQINVGAVHDGPGRREYARYVYLSEQELATLLGLVDLGIKVRAQDLPEARAISVAGWKPTR